MDQGNSLIREMEMVKEGTLEHQEGRKNISKRTVNRDMFNYNRLFSS